MAVFFIFAVNEVLADRGAKMLVHTKISAAVMLLLSLALTPAIVWAQTGFFDHATGARRTRLWIPPEVDTLRGILIVGNGAGSDWTWAAQDNIYQRFGELHNFAVIGTGFWRNFSDPNEIAIWDDHLAALATASGHPELVNAPWAPIGWSNGGEMSYGFNALRPEKVVAFIANKGCCYNNRLPTTESLNTPGLLIAGERDTRFRRDSIQGLFEDNRPRGALWSWVEEENTGHANPNLEIVLPFMAEAIRLRYPKDELPSATDGISLKALNEEEGWLVDQTTWKSGLTEVSSYADYSGDKSTAGWLLNESMAQLYRAFSTYDKPVSIVNPAGVALGESLSDQTPIQFETRIDTSSLSDWTKVELFNYSEKVGEVFRSGNPQTSAIITTTLLPGNVHALTALVTHADGMTLSTTNIATVLTAQVPEPAGIVLLLGLTVMVMLPRCGVGQ